MLTRSLLKTDSTSLGDNLTARDDTTHCKDSTKECQPVAKTRAYPTMTMSTMPTTRWRLRRPPRHDLSPVQLARMPDSHPCVEHFPSPSPSHTLLPSHAVAIARRRTPFPPRSPSPRSRASTQHEVTYMMRDLQVVFRDGYGATKAPFRPQASQNPRPGPKPPPRPGLGGLKVARITKGRLYGGPRLP